MKSKRILAVLLAMLMLLSTVTVAFSVFASSVAEAAAEESAEDVVYTREELQKISDTYGYDLTDDQINAILSGEITLSETVGDKEEDEILIVELGSEGALAQTGESDPSSNKVEKARKNLAKDQETVQARISRKVLDGSDVEVKYSYTLLTNSFAMTGKPSQINEIAKIHGVKSVYTAPIWTPVPTDAETNTAPENQAANYFTNSTNTTSNKGTGTVVAVIDTGLDSTYSYDSSTLTVNTTFHKAFQNDVTNPKVSSSDVSAKWKQTNAYNSVKNSAALQQFTNSLYRSSKVPYAFAYSEDNIFVGHKYFSYANQPDYWSWAFGYFYDDEQGDHGTHVSGITAGYETDSEGKVVFEGVAPDAQLFVMKVFGDNRAGNFSDILAAMEDSVLLGADVINLSLGTWAGFTYGGDRPDYDSAFQAAADAGVIVCSSAGNDYTAAKGTKYGTDLALASNPDNGIVGSPASYDDNLAVASMASNAYYAKSVTVDGRDIAYTNNATEAPRSIEKHAGTTKNYAILKDDNGNVLTGKSGEWENFAVSSKVKGKYAVIRRGETFTKSVAFAEDYGAIGLIVFDHSDGQLVNMMENTDVNIPAIFISKSDGEYLVGLESNPDATHTLQITNTTAYVNNPVAGTMSDFSSWGVTPDLKLKPEITGYGGNVYSTLQNGKYGLMSGTSMSSPYLAGVASLVVQELNNTYNIENNSFLNYEAAYVNRLASEIGTLDGTPACEKKIHELETALALVPDEYKSGRYSTVNVALDVINRYYDQFTSANATTKLNAIGSYAAATADAYWERIDAARIALESLSATAQSKVTTTNKNKLRNAQRTLLNSYLMAQLATVKLNDAAFKKKLDATRFYYDRWLANPYSSISATNLKRLFNAEYQWTNSLINGIGEVELTLECKAKIDEARRYYNNLMNTADANATTYKNKVTTLATLEAAEAAYANLLAEATNVANVNAYTNNVVQPASIDDFAQNAYYGRILYNGLSDSDKAQVTNYSPEASPIAGSVKQQIAKALMMSTATPVIDAEAGIPYSPRKQGAGLVDIDAALTSKAYVTVDGSPTPKIDFGDDKAKTGVYELRFDVVNISDEPLSFDVSANVQTEKVEIQDVSYQTRRLDPEKAAAFKETGLEFREKSYSHRVYAIDELEDVKFMSGEPYDLTALSTVTANTVTVPAGQTVSVTVTVTLGADAKAYMDENFVNGIYVEGFITLTSRTAGQPNLNVPYMGFYGDWTQAPMLDEGTWEDDYLGNPVHPQMGVSTGCNVYWGSMVGNFNYPLGVPNSDGGETPYDVFAEGATYIKDVRNVFGGELSLNTESVAAELSLLRSARTIKYTISDAETGEIYSQGTKEYERKSYYYSDSVGMVNCGYFDSDLYKFDGKIQGTQNYIEPGTKIKYDVEVFPDYGTEETVNNVNNTMSFYAYFDGATPTVDKIECYLNEETSDVMLHYEASDDFFVSEVGIAICGYLPGDVEDTVYLHTMFYPEHAGDTVEETLNISEWARNEGLLQMRSVRLTVEDFTQKEAVNPNLVFGDSYKEEYWISFFDKVKVSCITDILPVGSEAQLNVDYIYGRKLLSPDTDWMDPEHDANNSEYGLEEDFIYSTSDPSVVRVTSEGVIVPVSAGYADISATGRFGKSTGTMRIRVIEDPVQLQVAATEPGGTVTLTEDVFDSSLLINKDTVIDLNGHSIHGIDGYPTIRVIGGNVTIKNGTVDARFGNNSKKALLTDILEDNAAAIRVEGGNVTLDGLTVNGATFNSDGTDVVAGSAVVQAGDGNLKVKSSDLSGLYAVNNSAASGTATFVSGNFDGILGAVASMKKVVKSEGSEFIDMTNTLAGETTSYLGTIEGGSVGYYLPQNCLFISAEQIAAATPSDGASVTYDEEKGCAVFTFDGSRYAVNSYLAIPDVNIENCSDYTFAAILSNGMPSELTYTYAGFSSSAQTNNQYMSGEEYGPTQDGSGKLVNYVKPLTNCQYFTGSAPTLYFWPGAGSYRTTGGSMDIYGVALYNNKADAMSFSVGRANAYTNNLKVCAPQSFNTQLIIDGTTLNVNTSFPDESDGGYKWTANELSLYSRTVNGDNSFNDTFVESKPITPDENGDVSVSFDSIDPSNAYVIKVNFALSLTADNKASYFSVSESSAAVLAKIFPDLLDEMLGVDALETSVADLLNFFLYDMREGFVERDARHYDCPLGPAYIANYPYYEDYPDIIGRNSNNDYTTWTAYWDGRTFSEFIGKDKVNYDDTVTRISYAVLFASILGDAKMNELMANIQSTVPEKTWNMLNEDMRVGNFGLTGSVPTYKAQLAALKAAATGETAREQLVNGLTYLANNFTSLYASVLSVINSTYAEGVEFKSYSDPTANDSLLNVLNGKAITDTYNFGAYNDRHDEMVEKVDAVRNAVAYTQNAKNGLVAAMNAALYGTLASYKTEASDLLNLYFDENVIPGGEIDLGINVEYESEANYDGYITYELNGGVNDDANPIGYQRLLPVTFAAPSKEGYTFVGWYTTPDFQDGTEITGTTGETAGDLNVYAKWAINSYTMTFMNGETVVDTVSYNYGQQTAATDKLTIATGLTFKYWYEDDSSKAYTFGTMPAHDVILKAQLGYMSLDGFTKDGDTYVWPKDNHASLRLTVDRDCTIDFGGKIVSNMNDLAIIVVEGGKNVTIKNAIFAPASYLNTSDENYTIYVDESSTLTLENCVVKGAETATDNGSYASCSAIKIKSGTLNMTNCVVTGKYAVDNTKYSDVLASPSVNYNTGIYAGLIRPFVSITNVASSNATKIDVSSFVSDAPAAEKLAKNLIVNAAIFDVDDFAYNYDPYNDTIEITADNSATAVMPDGSEFVYVPVKADLNGTEYDLVDNYVKIENFDEGTYDIRIKYDLKVKFAEDTAAFIYELDDQGVAGASVEISAFDALLPKYDNIITKWNNNKDKILQKFAQYADNVLVKEYMDEIRAAIDNIEGTGSKIGIIHLLEPKLEAYKELSTDAEKLAWLLANKGDVIALTIDLDDNTLAIAMNCLYLNALAQTFFGTDYTDKLLYVFEIRDMVNELRVSVEKQPSVLADDYAAASDKGAFVNNVLSGATPFADEEKIEGEMNIGSLCPINSAKRLRISKTEPVFDVPAMYTVLQNTYLKDITLPAKITWKNPNTELIETGIFAVDAIYTPDESERITDDGDNHDFLKTVEFTIDVEVISPATYCERHGHDFAANVTVEPYCTTEGNTTRTCNLCGYVDVVETYEKLGHIDTDNNNICDRCKEYINDTGKGGVNFLLGALNYISNFLRGIVQLLTGKAASSASAAAGGSKSSIFAWDNFIVRFLRLLFKSI